MRASKIKRNLVTGTLLMASALTGYGRRAFAGCYSTGAPNYLCSGANYSPLGISANNATVTTDNTFSVNTASGDALTITGNGNLVSFTDTNHSSITATSGTGLKISATGDTGGTGAVAVNTNGTITGDIFGIYAINKGTGALTISATGDVTGVSGTGIDARNKNAAGTDLSIYVGTTSGVRYAIRAANYGTGALTITANGDVSSTNSTGIRAANYGSGALTMAVTGNVTSQYGDGITAYNRNVAATDLSITVGEVTAYRSGIRAVNSGAGALTINATGDVIGTYGRGPSNFAGIYARNRNVAGTDLSVTAGAVSSHSYGIQAINNGAGALTIAANGDVNGNYRDGIKALNSNFAGGTDLSITAGGVSGGRNGIYAINQGTGALTITASGDVTGKYGSGILAGNNGTGALTIAITGSVTSSFRDGVEVFGGNYTSAGGDLSITTGAVSGGYRGFYVFNSGPSALNINATGDVTGRYGSGIYALNNGNFYAQATDLSITTTNVGGYSYGIRTINRGSGALTITAAGDIDGRNNDGIYARNYGTNLIIAANAVSGGMTGINAINHGTGSALITSTGSVAGTYGDGINAVNYGTDLTINTAAVNGYTAGIDARNYGSGALSITAGNVTATGTDFYSLSSGLGVYARNQGTDLVINTAGIDAGVIGIFARNYGTGALQIASTGDVFGGISGIYAINNGTDLSITTGRVTSNGGGIYGRNLGTGALSITATGDVIANNFGVYASEYNGTDVNINVGYVKGNGGVAIKGFGTGAVNLIATGTINSTGEAVRASNYTGNGMSINVQDAIGSIEAKNYNYGAVAVSARNVESSFFPGVWVYNRSFYSTDVMISANSITVTNAEGIKATNDGTGILSISVSGDIHASSTGIWAYGYGTDLTINAHNIDSYFGGVDVGNHGNVVGGGYGIRARNYGTDLTISTAGSSGYLGGIFAFNHGSGALSITASGNVTAYGVGAASYRAIDGIYARNYGTNLTIATAEVSGGLTGIDAVNHGSGRLSITTTGDVTGTLGDAIYALNNGTGPLNISIPSGVTVHGGATGIEIGGNAGFGSSGVITAGNITGDNGTAISLNNLTASTPITVNGGTINGDVIDSHPAGGFSPVTFAQNFTTNGNFNVSGIEVSAGKTLTVGSGNTLTANTFTFDILNKTTFGRIAMTDTAFALRNPISANDGQIFVNVTGTDNLNGHKFQIVDGDGTHAVLNGPGNTLVAVGDNSALWDFDVVDGTHFNENASDLFLKAKKDHTNNGSIANTNSLNTLLSLAGTSNPQLLEALGNINTAPTDGALDSILESTLPDISGSDYAASQGADDTMNALEETRLASLRTGDDESGMAAGDMAKGFGIWGQVFGQHADQGERDAVAGYTANTWGGAVGVDTTNIADRAVIGLAFSYGRTNASSDNSNTTDTDIDSYQLSIYADYDLAKNTYLSGMAGFTWGNVDTERHNVTGVPGLTAHGSFNTQQFAAQVEAGHDFAVSNGMTLTPNVLAHWTNWNPDSYTETGAGGANMHVEGDELDKFELGAGVKAAWSLKNHDGSWFKPELRASYRYDLEDDRIDDTAQFTGGGVAFSVPGPDPARGTVDLGASMKLMTTSNWTFTASYDFNWKDEYTAHSGFLRAGYKF